MAKKKKSKSKAKGKGKTGASRIAARKVKTGRVARAAGKDVASAASHPTGRGASRPGRKGT